MTLKRAGNDLLVIQEGDDSPSLVLADYFANAGEPSPLLLGMAEDGMIYSYVPLSGKSYETGYLLTEGRLEAVALGGDAVESGVTFFAAQEESNYLFRCSDFSLAPAR
ncbi:hypothetical protein [Candidatus Pantoea persica]|uniref:hypothetical protein n=1 Tax=Candidatus Pantoea persica TaxID=2518128 RepID=UPI00215D724C|nr:hypothetical protein [Candidatus Pantoea persica]